MKKYAIDLWERARRSLATARSDMSVGDADASASRAYYAAFYAVSALFALEGKSFKKHSAVDAAVHRDLVRTGRWPAELGADYRALLDLRYVGDYGGGDHVTDEQSRDAITHASAVIAAVKAACPGLDADRPQ